MRKGWFLAAIACLSTAAAAGDTRFAVELRFDPAAAARLAEMGERVMVAAWFYGEPARPGVPVDEIGLVFLGGEEAEIWPQDQTLHLGGNLGSAPFGFATEARVNINVFSARRAHADNLLDCGLIEGPIAAFQAETPRMVCTLLAP